MKVLCSAGSDRMNSSSWMLPGLVLQKTGTSRRRSSMLKYSGMAIGGKPAPARRSRCQSAPREGRGSRSHSGARGIAGTRPGRACFGGCDVGVMNKSLDRSTRPPESPLRWPGEPRWERAINPSESRSGGTRRLPAVIGLQGVSETWRAGRLRDIGEGLGPHCRQSADPALVGAFSHRHDGIGCGKPMICLYFPNFSVPASVSSTTLRSWRRWSTRAARSVVAR